jgi:hypothetical protein
MTQMCTLLIKKRVLLPYWRSAVLLSLAWCLCARGDEIPSNAIPSDSANLVAGVFVAWLSGDELVATDHGKSYRFDIRTGTKAETMLDRPAQRSMEDTKKLLDGIRASFPESVVQKDPVTFKDIEWKSKWTARPNYPTIIVVPDAQNPSRQEGDFAVYSAEGRTPGGEPSGRIGVHNALYALLYKRDRYFKLLTLEIAEHHVENTNGEWNYAWHSLAARVDQADHKILIYFSGQPLESDVAWQAGWSPFNAWWFDPSTATLKHVVLPDGPWVADASDDGLGRAAGCFSCGCDCYRGYDLTVGGGTIFIRVTAIHDVLRSSSTGIFELTSMATTWRRISDAQPTLDQIAPDGCRLAINRPAGVEIVALCGRAKPK